MRYYNEVAVEPIVFKNLQLFRRGNKDDNKKAGDMLFDRINVRLPETGTLFNLGGAEKDCTVELRSADLFEGPRWARGRCARQTSLVNKHLNSLMPGLTAKVFRTYNASITFQVRTAPRHWSAGVLVAVLNRVQDALTRPC